MYQLTTNKHCKKLKPAPDLVREKVIDVLTEYLADDMMAVALAAPQLGYDYQVFICRKHRNIGGMYINPVILERSKALNTDYEMCRSLPDIEPVKVNRHSSIKLQYEDVRGNEHVRTFHGHSARIVQHEMDHLRGIMIGEDQRMETRGIP